MTSTIGKNPLSRTIPLLLIALAVGLITACGATNPSVDPLPSWNDDEVKKEIVADVESGDKPANGVILSQGGRFGGWSLYVLDGTPVYTYNYVGIDMYSVKADTKLPKGKATVKMDFAYDGGDKPGAGGTATLFINGKAVGSARIEATEFSIFSADETASVGVDFETPVSEDYDRAGSEFTGKIDKVTVTLK